MSSKSNSAPFAVSAHDLGKRYFLYERPSDRLKQILFGRFQSFTQEFWALQHLNLNIKAGEVVGIIGNNGAGKSTLLQLLCGTLKPSSGSLTVHGRVTALLELGAGFNPDFSGRENIFMNAAILGMRYEKIKDELDNIIAFADIGSFIDQPVKTYSSGMFMRLAFAVATSSEPDILIIDEALSVGDGAFARKSFERIMKLKDQGATILFCSHAMYQIEALCSRVLWLEQGQLRTHETSSGKEFSSTRTRPYNRPAAHRLACASVSRGDVKPMSPQRRFSPCSPVCATQSAYYVATGRQH